MFPGPKVECMDRNQTVTSEGEMGSGAPRDSINGGHLPPKGEIIVEVLTWFDKYLGEVE